MNDVLRGQVTNRLDEADLRVNEGRGEIVVSLYGEAQKEVIADLLAG